MKRRNFITGLLSLPIVARFWPSQLLPKAEAAPKIPLPGCLLCRDTGRDTGVWLAGLNVSDSCKYVLPVCTGRVLADGEIEVVTAEKSFVLVLYRTAEMAEFVSGLPLGVNTVLTYNGVHYNTVVASVNVDSPSYLTPTMPSVISVGLRVV